MSYEVIITYTNGESVRFGAQQFDLPASVLSPGGGGGGGGGGRRAAKQLARFDYTDASGRPTPLYLTLEQVSGIVVISNADQEPPSSTA